MQARLIGRFLQAVELVAIKGHIVFQAGELLAFALNSDHRAAARFAFVFKLGDLFLLGRDPVLQLLVIALQKLVDLPFD